MHHARNKNHAEIIQNLFNSSPVWDTGRFPILISDQFHICGWDGHSGLSKTRRIP